MKIAGTYTLPVGPVLAYRMLQDPDVLAKAMPGCEALERIGDDEYRVRMKMVLAALSGQFDGKVKIADCKPHESFRLHVEGSGKIGFMNGEGLLKLAGVESGTEVSFEGDVHVGGTLAAVGQRMIDTTARMMIKRFFDKLADLART